MLEWGSSLCLLWGYCAKTIRKQMEIQDSSRTTRSSLVPSLVGKYLQNCPNETKKGLIKRKARLEELWWEGDKFGNIKIVISSISTFSEA